MKQSSIEWLKKEFEKIGDATRLDITWNEFDSIIEKAKEMHKQELKLFWKKSESEMHNTFSADMYRKKTFEQYYNETYNDKR